MTGAKLAEFLRPEGERGQPLAGVASVISRVWIVRRGIGGIRSTSAGGSAAGPDPLHQAAEVRSVHAGKMRGARHVAAAESEHTFDVSLVQLA